MLCRYLADVAKEKGITNELIANRTGFKPSNVSRMLAGIYSPSLDNYMRLAEAVGVYFFVIDKEEKDDELVKMMKERWGKMGKN